jgi:hypothetical protein
MEKPNGKTQWENPMGKHGGKPQWETQWENPMGKHSGKKPVGNTVGKHGGKHSGKITHKKAAQPWYRNHHQLGESVIR